MNESYFLAGQPVGCPFKVFHDYHREAIAGRLKRNGIKYSVKSSAPDPKTTATTIAGTRYSLIG